MTADEQILSHEKEKKEMQPMFQPLDTIQQIIIQFGREEIGNRLSTFAMTSFMQMITAQLDIIRNTLISLSKQETETTKKLD